jgi:hypothetical protein
MAVFTCSLVPDYLVKIIQLFSQENASIKVFEYRNILNDLFV